MDSFLDFRKHGRDYTHIGTIRNNERVFTAPDRYGKDKLMIFFGPRKDIVGSVTENNGMYFFEIGGRYDGKGRSWNATKSMIVSALERI